MDEPLKNLLHELRGVRSGLEHAIAHSVIVGLEAHNELLLAQRRVMADIFKVDKILEGIVALHCSGTWSRH